MQRSAIETVLGGVVLVGAGLFLAFAWSTAQVAPVTGYAVEARFNAVDGLTAGSDVRIGGVKVGSVNAQRIDPETFQAVVQMTIRGDITLPEDSRATIASAGLLGGRYVKLDPGQSDQAIGDGGRISDTKDALSLEDLLGRAIFLITDEQGS